MIVIPYLAEAIVNFGVYALSNSFGTPELDFIIVIFVLFAAAMFAARLVYEHIAQSRTCSVCDHKIGSSSFFYSKLQDPRPYFHESCYRETLRGQRRRCPNCNVPLYNPKSREFVVPVVLGERHQLFCSKKCSETYKPLEGLAVSLPADLSCPYCKSVYSTSLTKCPHCGASRPKPSVDFMKLSPSEFEQKIAELLVRMGYSNVSRVGGSGDRAVDVVAQRKDEFGRVLRYAVQCKRYEPSSRVGSQEMQVFCSMISRVHGSDRGIFVTTSSFTTEAMEIADRFGVTVVDSRLLEELFAQYA